MSEMAAKQETLLVLKAQSGDRQALECLLAAIAPSVRAYLRSIAPAHADDLLQEVLCIVFRKLGYLRDPEVLRPWTFRIASREAFRLLRRERRLGVAEDPAILELLPAEPDPRHDRELALRAAGLLEAVPPGARAALVLHYLHELSFVEVASILEVPIGTVKSRINYGLGLLRRGMEKAEGSHP